MFATRVIQFIMISSVIFMLPNFIKECKWAIKDTIQKIKEDLHS